LVSSITSREALRPTQASWRGGGTLSLEVSMDMKVTTHLHLVQNLHSSYFFMTRYFIKFWKEMKIEKWEIHQILHYQKLKYSMVTDKYEYIFKQPEQ
jgi:hypothetical protein